MIRPVADRAAARARGRYCFLRGRPRREDPHASQIRGPGRHRDHARRHRRRSGCQQRGVGRQRRCRRPCAEHQPDHRAPRDQPRHLWHELCSGRPGAPAEAPRGPLGRQRHHQVQLPARHRQPRQRLVFREHPQHGQEPGRAAGRVHRGPVHRPEPARRRGQHHHRAADRVDAQIPGPGVRVQRGQVRPAAGCRSLRLRLRQRREHQRAVHHRERPGRHQQAGGRLLRRQVGRLPGHEVRRRGRRRGAVLPARQRARHLVRDAPRRAPGRGHLQRDAAQDRVGRRGHQVCRPGGTDDRPVRLGLELTVLLRLRPAVLRLAQLRGRAAGHGPPRRGPVHHLVPAPAAGLPAADRRAPARLLRQPLVPAGSERRQRGRRPRHPGAAAALHPDAVGPALRRPELDQPAGHGRSRG